MDTLVTTSDGSNTLYSVKYNQNFHDIKTGAIQESLTKHVIPAFNFHRKTKKLRILDICFGLGYNTLSTLYYCQKERLQVELEIFSPELDKALIDSLINFEYPNEFDNLKPIIKSLSTQHYYENEHLKISLHIGDARSYIKSLKNIDVVYQDAFSSEVNSELWTVEYFSDIYTACNDNAIITTYSVSTPIRLSMWEAGFEIYEIKPIKKKQTLGFKNKQNIDAKYIDMKLKQERNRKAKALYDSTND